MLVRSLLATVLLSALGTCAVAQTANRAPSATARKVYRDPVGHVSFSCPASWTGSALQSGEISMVTMGAADGEPITGFSLYAPDTAVSVRFAYRVLPGVAGEACRKRFQAMAGDDVKLGAKRMSGRDFLYAQPVVVATAQTFGANMYAIPWQGNCLIFEEDMGSHYPDEYTDSHGMENRAGRRKDAHAEAGIAAIERSIRLR